MLTLIITSVFVWYWMKVASFSANEAAIGPVRLSAPGTMLKLIVALVLFWVVANFQV
jgi:hypothetical protein